MQCKSAKYYYLQGNYPCRGTSVGSVGLAGELVPAIRRATWEGSFCACDAPWAASLVAHMPVIALLPDVLVIVLGLPLPAWLL